MSLRGFESHPARSDYGLGVQKLPSRSALGAQTNPQTIGISQLVDQ